MSRFIFLKHSFLCPAGPFAQGPSVGHEYLCPPFRALRPGATLEIAPFWAGPGAPSAQPGCLHPIATCVCCSLVSLLHCLSPCGLPQLGLSSIFKIPPSIQGFCSVPITSKSLFILFQHKLVSPSFYFFSKSESVPLF